MAAPNKQTHTHYRPYFIFKDGREKYGMWHHSKRVAWTELRTILYGTECQWMNAECLAQNGYGIESYRVPHKINDCCGEGHS